MELVCFLVALLTSVNLVHTEYPPVYPSSKDQKVAFACQDSYIYLNCTGRGERIRILLANYGRFSLVVCNQDGINKGWDLQCSSKKTLKVVGERCDGNQNCTFAASNYLFGDPCPGTKKYIEIRYYCEKTVTESTYKTTTTTKPTTPTSATTAHQTTQVPKWVTTHSKGSSQQQKDKLTPCPEVDNEGIYWVSTEAGEVLERSCPYGMIGQARWQCGMDGNWRGKPDLTECISPWMEDIKEVINSSAKAEDVVERLNYKMKGKKLMSGDLKTAAKTVLPGLIDKIQSEMKNEIDMPSKKEKVQSFTKEIVKTGSELLNKKQQESWKNLNATERQQSATAIIVSMETMALEVAATLDEPMTIASTEDNILMEVSMMKIRKEEVKSMKLPAKSYDSSSWQNSTDTVSLPLDSFTTASVTESLAVTFLLYNNLEELLNPATEADSPVVVTKVVSASVNKHTYAKTPVLTHQRRQLSRPMNFTLTHNRDYRDNYLPSCSFWDMQDHMLGGEWSQDGCRVVSSDEEKTVCQCDHLTNFAVLMDVTGTKLSRIHEMSLRAITYVGCIVSIFCLTVCFISFTIFRNLQSDRNTIHKNLVLCLLIAELLFVFGIGQTGDKVVCAIIAGCLHFFFLTSFAWMCLEGIQLYFMLIEVFEAERSRVRWFYAFGYGVPLVIVAISAGVDYTGYGTETHCWLRTDNYFILSFVIPAAVVVLINIVMLSIAVYMMCRHAGVTASAVRQREKGKLEKMGQNQANGKNSIVSSTSDSPSKAHLEIPTWLKGSAVLVVLLGLTWVFGFMYVNEDSLFFAYVFTSLNSLQGLFIFIFHCFMDRKVKKEYRRAIYKAKWLPMCCRVNIGGYTGSLSSPPSSSSGPQNFFMRLWSSRKRRRSSATSTTTKKRGSNLDSYLLDSSCTTTGTGVNRYSYQSDKLLPNGQNPYVPLPTHMENGVNDLSVFDCSVVDSEYVTEYCQQSMQVSREKRRYSSGSEDDEKDNISRESTNKNRLSFLSTDSELKIQSDFVSENDDSMINYVDENEDNLNGDNDKIGEFAKDFIHNLIESVKKEFPDTKDKSIYDCLDDSQEKTAKDLNKLPVVKTNSTPNVRVVVDYNFHGEPDIDMSSQPLLGSLPNMHGESNHS